MDPAIETIVTGLLREHPIAVLSSVAGFAGAIVAAAWAAGKGYYARTIDHLRQQLDLRDERIKGLGEEIGRYRDRLQVASPDEAKARLDRLEAELASLRPRRLSTDDIARFRHALGTEKGAAGLYLDVTNTANRGLYQDLIAAFHDANWNLLLDDTFGSPRRDVDIIMVVPAERADDSRAKRLKTALETIGLRVWAESRAVDVWTDAMPSLERVADLMFVARWSSD